LFGADAACYTLLEALPARKSLVFRMSTSPREKEAPEAAEPTCPVCGLTARDLREMGRMGCATCYTVFAAMVEQATVELHGTTPAPPPPLANRNTNPWPTRRAEPPSATPPTVALPPKRRAKGSR
jgi:hypothetical protein